MRKIEILPVGATGRKMVEYFPNDVSLQCVESKYTNGKVDIHITIGGESSTKGANHNQTISVSDEVREMVEMLGARITGKHIIYGKQMNDVKAKLSKLADTRVIAEYISQSLSK
jgi:hypothetical protein